MNVLNSNNMQNEIDEYMCLSMATRPSCYRAIYIYILENIYKDKLWGLI